jgi:hypothetical protein
VARLGGSFVQHAPHYIWNYAPQLINRDALEDAFAKLLTNNQGWGSLADEHSLPQSRGEGLAW